MNYEAEVYQPPTPATASSVDDDTRLGAAFRVLTWVVLGTLMLVWAVVGFVFWLPRMLREMAGFSLSLVHATMKGTDMTAAGDSLKGAIDFYRRGFELAHTSVMKTDARQESGRGVEFNANHLVKEALWALLVWWVVLSVIGWTDLTPVALVGWVMSGAWLQTLGNLAVGFWGWLDGLTGVAGG